MSKELRTFKVTAEAIRFIAQNMRAADKAEIKAGSGRPPLEVLQKGVMLSNEVYALYDPKGWPCAIFGVVPVQRGHLDIGAPWLLGTDSLIQHRRHFHRHAKAACDKLVLKWGVLSNIVDARNKAHINWLRHLGFKFGSPIIAGVEHRPFLPFSRTFADV